jgi:bifunctional non-homologous end joining protein LigD
VRLYTRNGYDFANRFPRIIDAIKSLPVRSCFIDGVAIVVDQRGLSNFDLLRSWRHDHAAVLCAFDLIELDGKEYAPGASRRSQTHVGQYAVAPPYQSGRTDHWLKIENPAAPAVKREAEEDWGGKHVGEDEDERRFEPLDCLE